MVDQRLRDYIKQNMGRVGPDEIKRKLVESGWDEAQVNEALQEAMQPPGGPTATRPGKKPLPIKYIIIGAVVVVAVVVAFLFWPAEPTGPYCGDGVCDVNETVETCPEDCTEPPPIPIIISIDPPTSTAGVGDSVTFDVRAADSQELFGFQFNMEYDSSILEFDSITDGPFFSNNGADTTFCIPPKTETAGLLKNYACTRIKERGEVKGVTGEGVIARVTFTALSAGTSPITIKNAKFANKKIKEINSTISNGQVIIE